MQRVIEFKARSGKYIMFENGMEIFSVDSSDLKFDSAKFYEGVYKKKSPNIELKNSINETDKIGSYIFAWLQKIVAEISSELGIPSEQGADKSSGEKDCSLKVIRLYAMAACAGDGFYADSDVSYDDYKTFNQDADFAVKISGKSMEPTIMDGSMVLVKQSEELVHKDIGIFVVDGEVMCKRYMKSGRGYKLVPDNTTEKFKSYTGKEIGSFKLLGKVIDIIHE